MDQITNPFRDAHPTRNHSNESSLCAIGDPIKAPNTPPQSKQVHILIEHLTIIFSNKQLRHQEHIIQSQTYIILTQSLTEKKEKKTADDFVNNGNSCKNRSF